MVLKTVSTLGGGGGGGGGGNVSGVSASLPVISSGGTTPNISFISPGTAGNVLTSIGGVWVSNAAVSGGGNGTPGGANTTIQFNNSGAFGGSANLTWDGANVQIGSSGLFKLSNGVTNYVAFKAPTLISSNVTWTLPNTDGTPNQVLITNGSGVLSWATANLTPTAPTNVSLPTISGSAIVGQNVSSTTGTWNGYPTPTYGYQWVRGASSDISGATSSTYQLQDADFNTTVKCRVTATNSAGSANATSASTSTIAAGPPQAPTSVTAVAGNAQATISFTAPAITGGSPIVYYEVTCVENGFINSGPSSPITITGLTNGVSYTFIVRAINGFGTSPAGGPSSPVTPSAVVAPSTVQYLVVAGGGGGGGQNVGGGGGAGGYRTATGFAVTSGTPITVTIGGGGPAVLTGIQGNSGQNSVFGSITSTGGGGGGHGVPPNGGSALDALPGGSGGGGGGCDSGVPGAGGAASPSGQGNAGANGLSNTIGSGGGGGAGAAGTNARSAGVGGIGLQDSVSGLSQFYAGGGGGGGNGAGGAGGNGGGGTGGFGNSGGPWGAGGNGTVNTGGGGGGQGGFSPSVLYPTGAGGSGVVMIAYLDTFLNLSSIDSGLITQSWNGSAWVNNASGSTTPNTTIRSGYKVYRFSQGTGNIQW
jgi:hypothetical protein